MADRTEIDRLLGELDTPPATASAAADDIEHTVGDLLEAIHDPETRLDDVIHIYKQLKGDPADDSDDADALRQIVLPPNPDKKLLLGDAAARIFRQNLHLFAGAGGMTEKLTEILDAYDLAKRCYNSLRGVETRKGLLACEYARLLRFFDKEDQEYHASDTPVDKLRAHAIRGNRLAGITGLRAKAADVQATGIDLLIQAADPKATDLEPAEADQRALAQLYLLLHTGKIADSEQRAEVQSLYSRKGADAIQGFLLTDDHTQPPLLSAPSFMAPRYTALLTALASILPLILVAALAQPNERNTMNDFFLGIAAVVTVGILAYGSHSAYRSYMTRTGLSDVGLQEYLGRAAYTRPRAEGDASCAEQLLGFLRSSIRAAASSEDVGLIAVAPEV